MLISSLFIKRASYPLASRRPMSLLRVTQIVMPI